MMDAGFDPQRLFDGAYTLPDPAAQSRLGRLVGIEDQKTRLSKLLGVLIDPQGLTEWAEHHHPGGISLLDDVLRRPPLVVLAGDVGSGKTELAETVGDAVARQAGISITVLPLSLSARGSGRVGEITALLSAAFEAAIQEANRIGGEDSRRRGGVILLIDEADALAQSRATEQMHHEDRAGVNALIRGVDRVAQSGLPICVVMCTNRLRALDPAIKRRAADVLAFRRPDEDTRRALLSSKLEPIGFAAQSIEALVRLTGPLNGRAYGFTFSDLLQRLVPSFALDAYPERAINAARAEQIASLMEPTPPFEE